MPTIKKLIYSHKNIILFSRLLKWIKTCECIVFGKYILFHKLQICDSLPLHLPTITFSNIKTIRENSVKFLGVIIYKNLTWKNHIEVVENKISKNIGVFYRASHLLDFKNLLKIYFSFIHIYISYANIAWASTFKTKLQGILKKQKHAVRITFHPNRFDHSRPLLKEMKALNVYQINLNQTLKFMHKTKYGINPGIFLPKFLEIDHQYRARFSLNSFYYKGSACKITSFAITLRGSTISCDNPPWSNSFLSQHKKSIPHLISFLLLIKFNLLSFG